MRKEKRYQYVEKKRFLPEITHCITCKTRLRKYATLSQRTIITLTGPLQMTHVGYRCPNADCPGKSTVYRSALADAQALPGFSFGLDIVALVGHLKLNQHQTVDARPSRRERATQELSDQYVATKCDVSF